MKLLMVEDDLLLQEGLALALGMKATPDCAATAAEADALIRAVNTAGDPDLGLPDKRRRDASLPVASSRGGESVLILTARDAIEDRINGLDSGADDYLVKPFALAELQARVRALIHAISGPQRQPADGRRYHPQSANSAGAAPVSACGSDAKEFALLTRLIMRSEADRAPRNAATGHLLTAGRSGSNTLEVHIHNLRRKLGKDRIKTVRGVGYRLESQK